MLLRLWRLDAIRATVVVSIVSFGVVVPMHWAIFGFERMIALGLRENLLQAVIQGLLAGPGAIYLFTRSVVLLGAAPRRGVPFAGAGLHAAGRLSRARRGAECIFSSSDLPSSCLASGSPSGRKRRPAATLDQVRDRLFRDHVLVSRTRSSHDCYSKHVCELRSQRDIKIIRVLVSLWFGSSLQSKLRTRANFRTATLVQAANHGLLPGHGPAGDLELAITALTSGLRTTLRTQLTSIWLPIQLGTIVAGRGHRDGHRRDRPEAVRLGVGDHGLAALSAAGRARRDEPSRHHHLYSAALHHAHRRPGFDRAPAHLHTRGVAINLATAWVVINVAASLIRNPFVNRVVAVSAWTIAALSILRLLDPAIAGARCPRAHRDRRVAGDAAADPQGDRVFAHLRCGRPPPPAISSSGGCAPSPTSRRRSRCCSSKLIRVALPHRSRCSSCSGSVGIDLSVLAFFTGAVGVGPRLRPAEDRLQPGERHEDSAC